MFADDYAVKTVVTHNPLPNNRGLRNKITRRIRRLGSIISGGVFRYEPMETDELLMASRDKDGRFRGNLKTIRPELGYWVYRESSASE